MEIYSVNNQDFEINVEQREKNQISIIQLHLDVMLHNVLNI